METGGYHKYKINKDFVVQKIADEWMVAAVGKTSENFKKY